MKTKHLLLIVMLIASLSTFAQSLTTPTGSCAFEIIDPSNLTQYPIAYRIWYGTMHGNWQSPTPYVVPGTGPGSFTFTSNETYPIPSPCWQTYFQIEVRSYDGTDYVSGFTYAKFNNTSTPNTLNGETTAIIEFH